MLPAVELANVDDTSSPEQEALMAESVEAALLVVLDRLSPAERVVFVLHDVFAVPYDEIGGIIGRTPEAVCQLAGRARRRVQGTAPGTPRPATRDHHRLHCRVAWRRL